MTSRTHVYCNECGKDMTPIDEGKEPVINGYTVRSDKEVFISYSARTSCGSTSHAASIPSGDYCGEACLAVAFQDMFARLSADITLTWRKPAEEERRRSQQTSHRYISAFIRRWQR